MRESLLLLLLKAFEDDILINTHTNQGTLGTQADLIIDIVQKIFRSISLMPVFTSLYHGDYEPVDEVEVDGMPIIDTYITSTALELLLEC